MKPWKFELVMKPIGSTTEGPVWDGEHLYFTHIRSNRILRYDPHSNTTTEWRTNTDCANGLAFDAHGHLFGCASAARSIVRFDTNITATVVDQLQNKRLNTPNDLAIDRKGRIWFTNPWSAVYKLSGREIDDNSVIRVDPQPDGTYVATRVTFDTTLPNGILVSPDQSTLYVAESGFAKGVMRELRAYPIREDGSLGVYRTLFTWGEDSRGVHRGIDGMCLDADGNIVATSGWIVSGAGPMMYVFSPTGRVLEAHPFPARPTNCCFGGPDMSTLFVTSHEGHLYKATTGRVGWAIYP